jgi:hypothetical protein
MVIDYGYDALGNLLRKDDFALSCEYGDASRSNSGNAGPHAVISLTRPDGTVVNDFAYDANGNMLAGNGGKCTTAPRTSQWRSATAAGARARSRPARHRTPKRRPRASSLMSTGSLCSCHSRWNTSAGPHAPDLTFKLSKTSLTRVAARYAGSPARMSSSRSGSMLPPVRMHTVRPRDAGVTTPSSRPATATAAEHSTMVPATR